MSLLNEMLHDLNKQKSTEVRPSLTAALSQPEHLKMKRYAIAGAGLVLMISIGIVLKPKSEIKSPSLAKTAAEPIRIPQKVEKPKTVSAQPAIETKEQTTVLNVLQSNPTDLITKQGESPAVSTRQESKDPVLKWREAQINRAVVAIKQGDTNNAKALLEDVLIREPSAIDAREKLASVYLSLGDFANATKVVEAGLEYAPEDPSLVTIQAKILMGQDKTKAAIKLLKNDHPSMTAHPDYYATLALALQSKGKISEAGTYYKSLIKVDPNNGKYWLGYAVSLEYDNRKEQAINAYQRASQIATTELAVKSYAEDRLNVLQG